MVCFYVFSYMYTKEKNIELKFYLFFFTNRRIGKVKNTPSKLTVAKMAEYAQIGTYRQYNKLAIGQGAQKS